MQFTQMILQFIIVTELHGARKVEAKELAPNIVLPCVVAAIASATKGDVRG